MQKILLIRFVLFACVGLLLCACAKKVPPPPPPPVAKDLERVESYNRLANLKEGIWRVEEWKGAAKKICQDSKELDCSVLAEIYHDYFYGYGSKADIKRAMDMLEKSCSQNDALSCLRLGVYLSHNKDKVRSDEVLAKAYQGANEACKANNAIECYVLALMYFEGYHPLQRDRIKAMEYALNACDMKLGNACIFLSINAENREEYLNARQKACTLGIREFCK